MTTAPVDIGMATPPPLIPSSTGRRKLMLSLILAAGAVASSEAFSSRPTALRSPPNHYHGIRDRAPPQSTTSSLFSTLPNNPTATHEEELLEHLDDMAPAHPPSDSWVEQMLSSYLGPRLLLGVLAAVYATNFPMGALMNDHLPASAATSARMLVAALALSPFVPRLHPNLRVPAVLCGCFTAFGYVTQSLSLMDTDPAKVSFLGSATVLWCPVLECVIDKKPMGLREAPQTWMAALLCLAGVGVLELYDPASSSSVASSLSLTVSSISTGDVLALLQAVGFGTAVFWTSRMLNKEPDMALPVTATLIATTAFLSALWCLADGWMFQNPDWQHLTLPGLLLDPSLRAVAGAVLWTGLISTSLNFYVELTALGRVPPSEASVILASEPLWAALFAAAFYHTGFTVADMFGGLLIVAACLVNAVLQPESFGFLLSQEDDTKETGEGEDC